MSRATPIAGDGMSAAIGTTRLLGLIGSPVEHSLSPAMHNAAFRECGLDCRYTLLPTTSEEFPQRILSCIEQGFAGWNVTVPHKERMLSYLDSWSDEVRATGACNTVRVEDGRLTGFNTDPVGFIRGLKEAGGVEAGSHAVLLGAGGAARAVAWALSRGGHSVHILSRKPQQAAILAEGMEPYSCAPMAHGNLDRIILEEVLHDASLLVNCTPAGMWPHTEESPLPQDVQLLKHLLIYDLVYRPRPTRLLVNAKREGCRTQDGLAMLVHQGAAAFELWTGRQAPVATMRQACLDVLSGKVTESRETKYVT